MCHSKTLFPIVEGLDYCYWPSVVFKYSPFRLISKWLIEICYENWDGIDHINDMVWKDVRKRIHILLFCWYNKITNFCSFSNKVACMGLMLFIRGESSIQISYQKFVLWPLLMTLMRFFLSRYLYRMFSNCQSCFGFISLKKVCINFVIFWFH